MKKNLKIVSAAAAALLAVAPVVAAGVAANPVSAAQPIDFNSNGTTSIQLPQVNATTINVSSDVNATAAVLPSSSKGSHAKKQIPTNISGSLTFSVNGKEVTAHFYNDSLDGVFSVPNANFTQVYGRDKQNKYNHHYYLATNKTYTAQLKNIDILLGTDYRTKNNTDQVTVSANDGTKIWNGHEFADSAKLTVSADGHVEIPYVATKAFKASDSTDTNKVSFYEKSSGNQASNGSVDINANNNQLNVQDIVDAINNKYAVESISSENGVNRNSGLQIATTANQIAEQLQKAGITVASNGTFTVPQSGKLSLNLESTALANGKTAKLALTVNVPNVQKANTDEYAHTTRVWNKKASYIYNENHVRQGNSTMYAIGSGHNVVANADGTPKVYNVGGIQAYKLSDGYFKGQYVDVRNFSTSRVHHVATNSNHKKATVRSRVFDVRGKAVKRMYINKGATVRVYGTKTIKGHKMYKIAKHNRYVKVANFR